MRTGMRNESRRGAALIFALGILLLFAAMGTVYVKHMTLEVTRSRVYVLDARARQMTERAVWAAIGEMQAAIEAGGPVNLGELPEYPAILYKDASRGKTEVYERYRGAVRLNIQDESAKLNINHAPTRVIQAMLQVNGQAARAIRGSLPRPGEAPSEKARWFTSPDDLAALPMLKPENASRVRLLGNTALTACSVADNSAPGEFININSASPEVLALLFNQQAAERIVAAREQHAFTSFQQVLDASQSDPGAFNIDITDFASTGIAFTSRSFRIACAVDLEDTHFKDVGGRLESAANYQIEMVVVFGDGGVPRITYWEEGQAQLVDEEAPAGNAEPEEQEEQEVAAS